ncbi:MAG: helix-turn-helix transcriptional regulator [Atopobiaceae bacterium]|nr:helix-turn-helix transcriptional regulator [Atopobiaceae bacterium]
MDPVSEHISEAIIRHWRDQGIGIKELARRLDLSVTSLGDALRKNRPFSLPEVLKLSVYFEIAPLELIDPRLVVSQLPEETQEELGRRHRKRGHS